MTTVLKALIIKGVIMLGGGSEIVQNWVTSVMDDLLQKKLKVLIILGAVH